MVKKNINFEDWMREKHFDLYGGLRLEYLKEKVNL